jgi:baseplate J-like protein
MSTQYICNKPERRALVLAKKTLNGIDFLEVSSPDQKTLSLHFLFDLPETPQGIPANPPLTAANIAIDGGVRITGINADSVAITGTNVLTVKVNAAGDYSTYTLRLVNGPNDATTPNGFDPQLSWVDFSFKIDCPSNFDCKTTSTCPSPDLPSADINYLAKDYESFRQLVLDRMAQTMPAWQETSPADMGIALVELLAYAGDQLSYYQDAVATEAYLGTARRRISVRRHARLLDYPMHDGCNARAYVFLQADPGAGVNVPKGTLLLTRANAPRGRITQDQAQTALNQSSQPFETLFDITAHNELNSIDFYTWSDSECCLPKGATRATLLDDKGAGAFLKQHPHEHLLLFEEVRGPATGFSADANLAHRHVVRLTSATQGVDPLTNQPIVEITWDAADALPFPLCLSTVVNNQEITAVSVARGNIVLADHGMTQQPETLPDVADSVGPYRPHLQNSNITFRVAYSDDQAQKLPAAGLLVQDPKQALPAIKLQQNGATWNPVRDLLSSGHNATDFVVETEDDDTPALRFGDGILGSKPVSGLKAIYRTRNGSAGNVGADSIAHPVISPTASLAGISDVRNPLPAQGGIDPETLDQARSFAPWAFRTQQRAVTETDYAEVTQRFPGVQKAQATLRWTGSWYTMFVTVDRIGGLPADTSFCNQLRRFLEQFRLAGYDLEIESPKFVPLDIAFTVCVAPGYFPSNVKSALLDVFSNRVLPDGTLGFFHPDNFTFGQPVFLSKVVATAMRVPGVRWVDTDDVPPSPNHFKRWGQASRGETQAGEISLARLEIARLDNDPSQPENGKIDFFMEGGL